MREFNYMVSGFCAATGLVSLMAGDYVWAAVVLFVAVLNFKLAGKNEE